MRLVRFLFAGVALCAASVAIAGETVGVNGSAVQYPTESTATIGDKKFPQKLTGTGMRKKAIINVYTIGSYVTTDFAGKTPEDLAGADVVKQLHLVMQRDIKGADMAHSFDGGIRANYPGEFEDELRKFGAMVRAQDVVKGDQVWITHVPGYGLHIHLVGKRSEFIPGMRFAKAVWDIYLGPKNVGEAVKKGLVSRLP